MSKIKKINRSLQADRNIQFAGFSLSSYSVVTPFKKEAFKMYQIKKYHTGGSLKGMTTTETTNVFFPVGFVVEKSYICAGYVVIGRKNI